MNVFELAKNYYPQYWDINRINALYEANKITSEEYAQIIGNTEVK